MIGSARFSVRDPMDRGKFLRRGAALFAVKFAGDNLLVYVGTGHGWWPADYLQSLPSLATLRLAHAPAWLLPAMALWALPFIWLGVTMMMRRALDAGRSPWWALTFFLPYANYVTIGWLCLTPSQSPGKEVLQPPPDTAKLPAMLLAVTAGASVGIGMVALGVYVRSAYGAALFFGTPFCMGALTSVLYNRRCVATRAESSRVVALALVLLAGLLVLAAVEGLACVAMALPLALGVGLLGGVLGRAIAFSGHGSLQTAALSMLVLPAIATIEPSPLERRTVHEVVSSIEIDAPVERVWRGVVAFPRIPEPTDLLSRIGIAYPQYARIEGAGVGAVRYCVFSTGPFVEPITAWEPNQRLAFDVTTSPVPLRELSLYDNVAPPHLRGFLRSQRGEFRLIALANGRTRLEGSTWYEIAMEPEGYWQLFSDYLIHRIHMRVLEHIKATTE